MVRSNGWLDADFNSKSKYEGEGIATLSRVKWIRLLFFAKHEASSLTVYLAALVHLSLQHYQSTNGPNTTKRSTSSDDGARNNSDANKIVPGGDDSPSSQQTEPAGDEEEMADNEEP